MGNMSTERCTTYTVITILKVHMRGCLRGLGGRRDHLYSLARSMRGYRSTRPCGAGIAEPTGLTLIYVYQSFFRVVSQVSLLSVQMYQASLTIRQIQNSLYVPTRRALLCPSSEPTRNLTPIVESPGPSDLKSVLNSQISFNSDTNCCPISTLRSTSVTYAVNL
jgi:hypothetical protein